MQSEDGLCVCYLSGPIAWGVLGKAPGQDQIHGDRTGLECRDSLTEPDTTGLARTPKSDF
jgi:hypothetical protein